ncbi:MAG: hypothetical protein GY769_05350 [bacterium]|nr:hypothetical protein [bacterium]
MSRWHSRWSDLLAPLGQAGLDLARAEYDVVSSEIRTSGRTLVRALLLLLIGMFALFWAVGVVALVLVEVGSLWLPRWGAALGVLGLFLLVGLIFAVVARRRLGRIERPTETVRRRLSEHRDWWDRRIAAGGPPHRRAPGHGDSSGDTRGGGAHPGPDTESSDDRL